MATETENRPATRTGEEIEGSQEAQKQRQTITCPDPSAHQQQEAATKLQEQASTAALYATKPEKKTKKQRDIEALGPDGKLSSSGAATSLKYARNQELPGFPSSGGLHAADSQSAANLANTNQKPFEHWKPDSSYNAGKAAMLAHDNQKPFEHWKPDASTAGSRAAILAHKDGPKLNLWEPEASKNGMSAAHIAVGKKGLAPTVDYAYRDEGKRRALIAATGAVRTSQARKRSDSAPATRPATASARLGTTTGMRSPEVVDANKWDSDAMQAARIQHLHMSRAMYTEHPPVEQFDREEQNHQAALKASAVSMAKKMYDMQQSRIEEAAGFGAARASAQKTTSASASTSPSLTADNLRTAAMQHLTLQEAAQRLAEEKLAKMKTDDATAFRNHYGYGSAPPRSPLSPRQLRTKLSIRGRKRANSDSEMTGQPQSDRWIDSDDEEQSRRIRNQTSMLRNQVQEVDVKKRQTDRAALIAAAEKKVHAQMHDMDERVFNDTGKMSPAMIEQWENKARLRVEKQREEEALEREKSGESGGQKPEKIHIGGGKYMDQSEIEAIARKRVNPTLLEIGEQAERQRAKDKEMQLEKEEKRREERVTKERAHENKEQEKKAKAEEKHASRAEKEAEKLKRREEKQMAKDEKRRSKGLSSPKEADAHPPAEEGEVSAAAPGAGDEAEAAPATTVLPPPPAPPITSTEPETAPAHPPLGLSAAEPETTPAPAAQGLSAVEPTATNTTAATQEPKPKTSDESKTTPSSAASPPGSPTKQDKGFRSIFNKFRRRSKAQPGEIKSFAGGHRLSRARKEPEQEEEKKEGDKAPTNNDEVPATASTAPTAPAALATETRASRSPSVSSLSSSDDDAPRVSQEIEDTPRGRPRQPAILKTAPTDPDLSDVSVSRTATNTTNNDFEEAHDRFDDGDLAPPQPSFASKKSESESGSPHRDSKFVEEF